MAGKNTAAFGIYPNEASVRDAVEALQRESFRLTDISVLFPHNEGTKDFAHEKGTKAPEGAAAGAGTGAVIGGALGWLAGVGAIAIPGVGPFLAAGPIMAALAGAGVGGTAGGRGCFNRHGYSRIRGKKIRGTDKKRRYTAFCPL